MLPIHDNQHGFRRNKSTDTATSAVTTKIEYHFTQKENPIGVFLDIQGAFDTILPIAIKRSLEKHKVDQIIVDWYYNLLIHRNLYTEHNGSTSSATIDYYGPGNL